VSDQRDGSQGAQVTAVDHVVLVTPDVVRAVEFYARVLGAQVVDLDEWDRGEVEYPALHFGSWKINVHPMATDAAPRAEQPVPGALDIALRWSGTAADAAAHLRACEVPVLWGPVYQEGARGGAESVYFRDPDGSLIELICYA
jgi:catechol 2,3-dioxygenase-like lactoylglutathione lyase family enzyme